MDISALNYSPENDISDPLSCIYPSECSNNQLLIMIDIVTESWSSEITWNITDNENNIVANSPNLNSFYGDYQVYTTYACLNINETYFFNSFDSYGDGWNGGSWSLVGADGATYADCGAAFTTGAELDCAFSLGGAPPAGRPGCADFSRRRDR